MSLHLLIPEPLRDFAIVSALSEKFGGWDGVRGALSEICACNADLDHFLCSVFDDFDRLAGELADRQRDLAEVSHKESTAVCDNALRDAIESLHRDHAAIFAALRASLGQPQGQHELDDSLRTVLSRLASLTGELVDSQSEQKRMLRSQQALMSGEMAAMRHLLEGWPLSAAPVQSLSAAPRRDTVTDPGLDAVLAQFERLETDLVQSRDA